MRELVVASLLVVAAVLIVVGIALVSTPAAWITAGVLLATLTTVIFG